MKRTLLTKTMLLLCALIAGSSSVWADTTVTWPGSTALPSTATDVENDENITIKASSTNNYTSPIRVYANTTITINAKNDAKILSVTYEASSTGNYVTYAEEATVSPNVTPSTSGKKVTWTYDASDNVKEFTFKPASQTRANSISITYTSGSGSTVSTPSFKPGTGIYTTAQSVKLECETEGATIYYTKGDNPAVPTDASTQYTGAISVDATTTIKAIAKKDDTYSSVSTAIYTILAHAGTEADPFTVADARNALTAGAIVAENDYYVTGYVAKKNDISSGQMTYWISDDGSMTSTIQCYKGKYIDGADFTALNAPEVGDLAVVKGKLLIYSGTTYEFAENNEVVNITPLPKITISKTSLEDFTYVYGYGPSNTQTFSVSGTTLSANITLSLGATSNYEMSLTENTGYTNELTLTPTTGAVAATSIYVRMKAGLAINASYAGTITLSSTNATNKTVALTGSVTEPVVTWDLSTNSYVASPTEDLIQWTSTYAQMKNEKNGGTSVINYIPTGQNSTRFYSKNILTITPASGYAVTRIVFSATTSGYATALKNSSWTNATAAVSDKVVTVTPTSGIYDISATIGGTCGFTKVEVYYEVNPSGTVPITLAYEKNTYVTRSALDFSGIAGLKAYRASSAPAGSGTVTLEEVGEVPTGTPLMLIGTAKTKYSIPVIVSASDPGTNLFLAGNGTTTFSGSSYDFILFSDGLFYQIESGSVPVGKAYLHCDADPRAAAASGLTLEFGDGSTGVNTLNVERETLNGEVYNLAGQRVANPTKGLYIVNGKKVVLK